MQPAYHVKNKENFLFKCAIYSLILHTHFADSLKTCRRQLQNFLPCGVQNKLLRSSCKFPWYIPNQTIHNTLKVEHIRKVIKNLPEKLYNSIPTIPNPDFFNLLDYDPCQFHKHTKQGSKLAVVSRILQL